MVREACLGGGSTWVRSLHGMLLVEGGVVVGLGGQIVGALGISGMTSVQDGEVAAAALAAVGATG